MASAPVSARTGEFASVPPSGILGFALSLPRPGNSHLFPTESSFASVLSGTRGYRSSRDSRRAFLGDLGSSDHHFPEAPSHLPAPRRRDWECIRGAGKVAGVPATTSTGGSILVSLFHLVAFRMRMQVVL